MTAQKGENFIRTQELEDQKKRHKVKDQVEEDRRETERLEALKKKKE
jgi:hypothetical protein